MKPKQWKVSLLALIVICFTGCGKDKDSPAPEPPPGNGGGEVTEENVSYTNFVGSLLQSKCSSCHTGSGPGTSQWMFSGYNSVKDNLARINDVVIVRKVMPQNGSLSNRELNLLRAWVDKGGPQ
ncbi:hypothetical protein ACFOET_14885 [Parapedobacter deserti]|uniref:Cytochrome c domain-containing protein n=1 Tax=Parapedobacter deserti TaxID=1912957 RepID=A0ABV7JS30_9SPHI